MLNFAEGCLGCLVRIRYIYFFIGHMPTFNLFYFYRVTDNFIFPLFQQDTQYKERLWLRFCILCTPTFFISAAMISINTLRSLDIRQPTPLDSL